MHPRKTRGFGQGKSPKKFSYTYEDVAKALGCSTAAARKHAQRGNYDPSNLLSVLEFVRDRLSADNSLHEDESMLLFQKIKESDKQP